MFFTALALMADAAAAPPPARTFVMPPRAAAVTGEIHQAMLGPIFNLPFYCVEHYFGQLDYAGDALGTDCMVGGGLNGASGFMKPYRTNGKTNADWYGWHAEVLAPVDGVVIGVLAKPDDNVPGTMGKPPAAMLQFKTADGVIVVLGHVTAIRVKLGDQVTRGQIVALDGNNGMARAPHIHVGAYVAATAEPLQIRWDQRAAAEALKEK
jgi:hypothetical protein